MTLDWTTREIDALRSRVKALDLVLQGILLGAFTILPMPLAGTCLVQRRCNDEVIGLHVLDGRAWPNPEEIAVLQEWINHARAKEAPKQ